MYVHECLHDLAVRVRVVVTRAPNGTAAFEAVLVAVLGAGC